MGPARTPPPPPPPVLKGNVLEANGRSPSLVRDGVPCKENSDDGCTNRFAWEVSSTIEVLTNWPDSTTGSLHTNRMYRTFNIWLVA